MPSVEALKKIIQQMPNDPFPRYGLAMELRRTKQFDEAKTVFAELGEKFPDYVAQYLMHGQMLNELGDKAAAKNVVERGLAAAKKKGDGHAAGELSALLAEVSASDDD
jgi:predicted Zn-dependent protease